MMVMMMMNDDDDDDECVWGGVRGGDNPMHRVHRIWMMAIGPSGGWRWKYI